MDMEQFNEMAWRDFLLFAWGQEDAHAAFRGATGRPQRTSKRTGGTPLDALICKAVGGQEDDAYMAEFIDWVTKNHWGANYAPKKWEKLRSTSPSPAESPSLPSEGKPE